MSEERSAVGYRDVLRVREFRALWLAHVASVLGDQVTRVALAALVLGRTGSVALSALSLAMTYLPWLVGGPLLGVLADRYPHRTVMVGCDLARAALVATLALPGLPVPVLLVVAAAASALGPPFEAARGASIPDVLTGERYAVGQSLTLVSMEVAQLGGFAVGGLLVTLRPGPGALLVDAASFLLSAVLLHRACPWRPGRGAAGSGARRWLRESAEGAVVVARGPVLRRLLVLCCVTASITVVPEALAVAQAARLGQPPLVAGLLCSALPLGTAVGALALGRLEDADRQLALVRPLALLAAAAASLTLLGPGVAGLLVLWFVTGFGAAALLPANVTFVQRVDPAVRGRALSVAQVALQSTQGLAVALAGLAADRLGPSGAVGWAGLVGLALTGALCLRWPAGLASPRPSLLRLPAPPVRLPVG